MHRIAKLALTTALAAVVCVPLAQEAAAQDLHPSRRPSPLGMSRTFVGDAYVRVVYSRPYQRGRDNIFGTEDSEALVPFGKIWRTGANEATEITVTEDVMVAGERLPAGTYSLFTTPGPERWVFHFNGELGLNGPGRFDPESRSFQAIDVEATNVLQVTVPAGKAEETVDQLTFAFEETDAGTDMILRWIDTEVRVPLRPAG